MTSRRHLALEHPANLRPHDHVVWGGNDESDLDYLAVTCFAGATRRNERMLFISDDPFASGLGRLRNVGRLIERGALKLMPTELAYPTELAGDAPGQLRLFDAALDDALRDGYSGICVVADNTGLLGEDDRSFEQWLAWEQLTDQFQATHPIVGVCYFDVRRVHTERLADLAAIHPVLHADIAPPPFRVFTSEGTIRAVGSLDAWSSEQLLRVLRNAPAEGQLVLDVGDAEFVDHHALRALHELTTTRLPIRVARATPSLQQAWSLLAPADSSLHFD